MKNNFENNEDKIEVEICVFAAYIRILIHEISKFIRLYIYKYTDKGEYGKSFEFDDKINSGNGCFIEINLFGKIMESINLIEVIYILDINNYFKDTEKFLINFRGLEKIKMDF